MKYQKTDKWTRDCIQRFKAYLSIHKLTCFEKIEKFPIVYFFAGAKMIAHFRCSIVLIDEEHVGFTLFIRNQFTNSFTLCDFELHIGKAK